MSQKISGTEDVIESERFFLCNPNEKSGRRSFQSFSFPQEIFYSQHHGPELLLQGIFEPSILTAVSTH